MKYSDHDKENHAKFMRQILLILASKNYPTYLKGGTALFLCHGLDRFSEDIDLNSNKKFKLENIIKRAANDINIQIVDIKIPKDSDTTKRYKVHYFTDTPQNTKTLKIETSYRDQIREEEVGIYNGIKAYNIESLIAMKLRAIEHRTKARDLYDIIFLAKNYPHRFTHNDIDSFNNLASNIDKLLSYEDDYLEDYILKDKFEDNIIEIEELSSFFIKNISKTEKIKYPTSNIKKRE